MILAIPLLLIGLALTAAAPFAAAWATNELARRLRLPARIALAALAVAASLWWLLADDPALYLLGALSSWAAVAVATTAATVRVVRRRAMDPGRLQRRIDAWHAAHPAMPPGWYGGPTQWPHQP